MNVMNITRMKYINMTESWRIGLILKCSIYKYKYKYNIMHLFHSMAGIYCRAKNESSYVKHTSCVKHTANIPHKKRLCKDRLATSPDSVNQLGFFYYYFGSWQRCSVEGEKKEGNWMGWSEKKAASTQWFISKPFFYLWSFIVLALKNNLWL